MMNRIRNLYIALLFVFCVLTVGRSQPNELNKMKKDDKPMLVYIYDPLCGWCYGFSPVMESLKKKYADRMQFEVISGGMILGEREGPIGEVAPYIKSAYKTVEQHTGVKFGDGFLKGILEPGTAIFSSWVPSKALSAFKTMKPEKSLEFAASIQKAIYFEGISPSDPAPYCALAVGFGLNENEYTSMMDFEEIEQQTKKEFELSSKLGVRGFPTVLLVNDSGTELLTNGYADFETLDKKLSKWLERSRP